MGSIRNRKPRVMTISAEASHIGRRTNPSQDLFLRYATSSARILLSLIFTTTGLAKLLGMATMVQMFDAIGFGQELRYAVGLIELGGAALLLMPGGHFLAGLLMTATMLGAVLAHLFLIGSGAFPAAALLTLAAFVAWRSRPEALKDMLA